MVLRNKRDRDISQHLPPRPIWRTAYGTHPGTTFLLIMVATMILGHPLVASAAITHLTEGAQGTGNKGFSWIRLGREGNRAGFTMTARSSVDRTGLFNANALAKLGNMIIERGRGQADTGAGVKEGRMSGSSGRSGGDEELILPYSSPVSLQRIFLKLNEIDFGHGLNDKDDMVLFAPQAGSDRFALSTETDRLATSASRRRGKGQGTLDFGSFSSVLDGAAIDAFQIRETSDPIYVGSQSGTSTVPVPTPSALLLGGLGTVFASWMHRRRNL